MIASTNKGDPPISLDQPWGNFNLPCSSSPVERRNIAILQSKRNFYIFRVPLRCFLGSVLDHFHEGNWQLSSVLISNFTDFVLGKKENLHFCFWVSGWVNVMSPSHLLPTRDQSNHTIKSGVKWHFHLNELLTFLLTTHRHVHGPWIQYDTCTYIIMTCPPTQQLQTCFVPNLIVSFAPIEW